MVLPTGNRHFADWDGGVIGSVAVNDAYDPDGSRPPLAAVCAIDGNLYLFSQNETKGTALSFDGKTRLPTPVIVAKRNIGGSISTPLIVDDNVIAAGYGAKVHVYRIVYGARGGVPLKTRDGRTVGVSLKEMSSFRAGAFESTPVVWNGRMYIGSRDGNFYCLGAKWRPAPASSRSPGQAMSSSRQKPAALAPALARRQGVCLLEGVARLGQRVLDLL